MEKTFIRFVAAVLYLCFVFNLFSLSACTEFNAEMKVDPGYTGQIDGYVPGTSSNGQLVYKVTDDGSGQTWYRYVPVGAMVPAKVGWHFITRDWKGQ
ncbi:hypothetical protein CD30_12795 [Ureibacillus massiliensis 4400831 = CIP 108448 = CCUG 49529]|uniref:Uncharacterized protein n=1 Tax=Ureibacillus massiliensis 4400831 = CIP 108448 = CCUG 49529 TaxID=1211035 RepID=A0A0A3IZP2_9BACL|nr:hypothetical protein [Ureibacillus massiliensis]KGR90239.1 hypothetical protein CD30_12795 [Ureibacillus massiliensis 4400831 = CIP 108448 = CCUG 49529]